jgi:PAS domain S-box-containing protein
MNRNEKTPDMTVLVVEDDELLNKSIRKLLDREGFTTEGFLSGNKVLERVFESSNDVLLLLDYSLPDLTAKEIVEKVRARGLEIPFVIVTGHGDEQLAVEMMKLGALDYIVKSLQFHEVVPSKVKRACEEIAVKRKLAQAEEGLKMAAAEWQKTFDSIADAVFILDSEQRIVRCNRATLLLLGKPVEEVIGMNCCKAIHGVNTPIAGCPVVQMKRSLNRESGEMVLGNRFFSITADPIMDSANSLIGAVHVISDITDRKHTQEEKTKLEEQLRQSQKMEAIGQLAGGVAHDFNNLLGGIMGNAELIQTYAGSDHKFDKYVQRVVQSVTKASDLTRQLLTFARKVRVNFVSVDVHNCIGNVIELLRHTIDKRIILATNFGAGLSKTIGDSNMLENALLNIAINARDAMPLGGTLSFATENVVLNDVNMPRNAPELTLGEYVRITIRDSGSGMDEKTMLRIFEPFFTTKEVGKGTGLGLAAVYGCVRQHHGHVMVESEIGIGSAFIIYLPVLRVNEQQPGPAVQICVKGKGNILIVDDDAAIGEVTVELLTGIGYTPTYMSSAAEAIAYFKKNHDSMDAVVLDIIMPKMNGLDVFRELKRISPKVKVIIASGYSDEKQDALLMEEGATVFVNKPYTLAELSTALASTIES